MECGAAGDGCFWEDARLHADVLGQEGARRLHSAKLWGQPKCLSGMHVAASLLTTMCRPRIINPHRMNISSEAMDVS